MQDALNEVCMRMEEYFEKEKQQNFEEYSLKVLVPGNLVTKIIGAKGCMIKEISNKADGASIKVKTSKEDMYGPNRLEESVVAIDGTVKQKGTSAYLI